MNFRIGVLWPFVIAYINIKPCGVYRAWVISKAISNMLISIYLGLPEAVTVDLIVCYIKFA
jgi:hypothetical protein